MTKKIFQAAFLPLLATLLFSGVLFIENLFGDLVFPAWFQKGVLTFFEMLIWFSGGWLFNRMLSLLFWDTLVKKMMSYYDKIIFVNKSFFCTIDKITYNG